MPKSRISLNIHSQVVRDNNRLMTHLQAIDPTSVLVLDGKGLGRDIKKVLPNTMVIIREFGAHGDDTIHLQMSPDEFLKQRANLAEGQQYYLYTSNEPGYDTKIIEWHVRLMELAAKERVPLVVGNFAVGIPRPEDWHLARRMLELLDQHRDLFVLGLHEYGCGVMTSGLVGGAPDDPAHPNYILPENWPRSTQGITQFHLGRFNFLIQYCNSIGLRPPRVILTEHGMDDLSDIKFWTEKLKVKSGYLNIRGWKSLTDQWTEWYGGRGWSPERAYFEQLKWADEVIYRNSIVEGQCIFSWGHSSNMWEQFDIAEAFELQALLEDYARGIVPTSAPVPSVPAGFTTPSQNMAAFVSQNQPQQPAQSTGFMGIGERTDAEIAAAQAQGSFVAPAIAVPATVANQPQATTESAAFFAPPPDPPAETTQNLSLTLNLSDAELDAVIAGLRAMNQVTPNQTVVEGFARLADALERARGVG